MTIPSELQDAVLAALFDHECGSREDIAYRLSFAKIDSSGGSYGKLQNDCFAQPLALHVLVNILQAVGTDGDTVNRVASALAVACPENPLSAADYAVVNAAIASDSGRALVSTLDESTLMGVIQQLNRCISYANLNGHATIGNDALIGMALWINQSGPPTTMLRWIGGAVVSLGGARAPEINPGQLITLTDLCGYLATTGEFKRHPRMLTNLRNSVAVGMRSMPPAGSA